MVVPEKPVFEAAVFSDFIEEVRQCIPLVQPAAEYVLYAAGAAVRDDVVYPSQPCPAFLLRSGILPCWAVPLSTRSGDRHGTAPLQH